MDEGVKFLPYAQYNPINANDASTPETFVITTGYADVHTP